MKKTRTLLLAFVMIFSFASCKSNADIKNSDGDAADEVTTTAKEETEKSPIYDKAYYDNDGRFVVENGYPEKEERSVRGALIQLLDYPYKTVDECIAYTDEHEESAGFFLLKAKAVSSKSILPMNEITNLRTFPAYTVVTMEILDIYESTKVYTDFRVGDMIDILQPYGFIEDMDASQPNIPKFREVQLNLCLSGEEDRRYPIESVCYWEFIQPETEYIIMFNNDYFSEDRYICVNGGQTKLITSQEKDGIFIPNLIKNPQNPNFSRTANGLQGAQIYVYKDALEKYDILN